MSQRTKGKLEGLPQALGQDEREEANWVNLARQGNVEAMDQLLQRYERRVLGLCLRRLGNYEEACDLAQEIFLKVFRGLPHFEGRSKFSTWLYRISLNACANYWRQYKVRRSLEGRSLDAPLASGARADWPSSEPGALVALETEEARRQLLEALDSLDDSQRQVLELVDIEQMHYRDAAETLDVSLASLKSRLFRARAVLKSRLERLRRGEKR